MRDHPGGTRFVVASNIFHAAKTCEVLLFPHCADISFVHAGQIRRQTMQDFRPLNIICAQKILFVLVRFNYDAPWKIKDVARGRYRLVGCLILGQRKLVGHSAGGQRDFSFALFSSRENRGKWYTEGGTRWCFAHSKRFSTVMGATPRIRTLKMLRGY